MNLEPLFRVEFAVADDLAHLRMEDLGAAAGQGAQAGFAQLLEDLLDRDLGDLCEPADLDRGEGLEVHTRKALLEAAHHLEVPLEGDVRVQAADDVELGDRIPTLLGRVLVNLLVRHLPGMILTFERRETTELAVVGVDADVGGIDVPVDVEEGRRAVHPLPHMIGQAAEVEDVRGLEAECRVGLVQPNTIAHLGGEGLQLGWKALRVDLREHLGGIPRAGV
jgi:hypothetical protein